MLAVGRATITGDVIAVVLEQAAMLLAADSAGLVIGNGAGSGGVWVYEDDTVVMKPHDWLDDTIAARGNAAGPKRASGADGVAYTHKFTVDGSVVHAVTAERTRTDDEFMMLTVRRSRHRPFDEPARALFEIVFAFADVAMQNMQLLSRLRHKAVALEVLATHDPLTGLANRRRFHDEAERAIANGESGAVLLIDLDRFKDVNDTLGHQTGDHLLVEVAERLQHAVGGNGLIARLGGDEFAVLLGPGTESEIMALAAQLHSDIERPVDLGEITVDVGASIGIAALSPDHPTISSLLRHADVAMYAAKAARTDIEVYKPEFDHYRPESLELVARFRDAIEHGELHVAFQPQFNTLTERVVGVEALARWSLPGIGPIQPSEFIPIAESTGLIRSLTRHVLTEAIDQCTRWQTHHDNVRVSVNIAPRVLLDPGFAGRITDLLDHLGLPPELLRLEVTETTVMTDPERAAAVLRDLANRGMSIAIDDFGTGHSSLAYLTSLPCHEIKIDRTFITALGHGDPRSVAVIASIIGLGHDLGIDVIAEGVETTHAAAELQRLGCRVIQGFLYSRPIGATEVTRVLAGTPMNTHQPTSPRRPHGVLERTARPFHFGG